MSYRLIGERGTQTCTSVQQEYITIPLNTFTFLNNMKYVTHNINTYIRKIIDSRKEFQKINNIYILYI